MLLGKLGLQLLSHSNIRVDYELAIKRFLYEKTDYKCSVTDFVKFLKSNFHTDPPTDHLVELVHVKDHTRKAFTQQNIKSITESDYAIELKKGTELHLLNDQSNSKRKQSNLNA